MTFIYNENDIDLSNYIKVKYRDYTTYYNSFINVELIDMDNYFKTINGNHVNMLLKEGITPVKVILW